jgi:hypothetical protein
MQHALVLLAKAGRRDAILDAADVASLRATGRPTHPTPYGRA